MRKLMIVAAVLAMSATAQAQSLDLGSGPSANGPSDISGVDPSQLGAMVRSSGGGMAQGGAGRHAARHHAAGHGSEGRSGQHESAEETKARKIAGKYGISW